LRWTLPAFRDDADPRPDIAFGRLEVSVSVGVAGRAAASSAPVAIAYSRWPRFVGLKARQWWLPRDRDLALDVVVLTHAGEAVEDVPVDVRIEAYDEDEDTDEDDEDDGDDGDARAAAPPTVLGHCALRAGVSSRCAFRAPKDGWYRLVASADGAAPTQLVRWIGGSAPKGAKAGAQASLELVHAGVDGAPARVRLRQPYEQAQVLFVVEYGRALRKQWVQAVRAGDSEFDVPLPVEWAPGVSLRAVVRRADGDATAFATSTLGAVLDLDVPRPDVALQVAATPSPARPGQELVVALHNPGNVERHATISLVDDSVYQQAADYWRYGDPAGEDWLGRLDAWSLGDWYGLEAFASFGNLFYAPEPTGSRIRRIDVESASPVVAIASADVDSAELETIQVTGSRIRAVDTFWRTPQAQPLRPGGRGRPGAPLARVRQRFLDTAYWNPDVVVPAGATRELRVPLPDNLTRWRVLAWTSDAGDGFALTQATVESALPVELRFGLPTRLFLGDTALGTVAARNHAEHATALELTLAGEGAGVHLDNAAHATVDAQAEFSRRTTLAPSAIGDVQLVARAASSAGGDALSGSVAVLGRRREDQLTQVGWIDAASLALPLPELPEGSMPHALEVEVRQGVGGWLDVWLADLRDYPHRCWEQMLSRAMGAAISRGGDREAAWPDAQAVLAQAMTNAPAFQGEDGRFHYFLAERDWNGEGNPQLSAYTLRSFERLRALGVAVPDGVYAPLAKAVAGDAVPPNRKEAEKPTRWEVAAVAAGAVVDPQRIKPDDLRSLWAKWDWLSWYARSELVRALARQPSLSAEAGLGIARLRAAGTPRGLRRVLVDAREQAWAMGSSLRDQCAIVSALYELDTDPAGDAARTALLRGVADLYSGGTRSSDTQADVACLLAMQAVAPRLPAASAAREVRVAVGRQVGTLELDASESPAHWTAPAPFAGDELRLRGPDTVDPTLNYSATLRFDVDMLQVPARAVGMQLERHYRVLRQGRWSEVPAAGVHEGDWVRVELRIDVPAWRSFVALTDTVPGGLVTRDIALAGVGGVAVRGVGDPGSWWFDARQTGATEVRMYAESLPPGTHSVYYFAQAVHPGEYLAPPAVAELMYGRGSRATTNGEIVRVVSGR
jgi:uncharacterized protein YfaS (alpha-2-macroglobulin family)